MTDDQIIEKMAKAMCLSMETDSNPPCEGVCYICKKQARAALAVARPIIREQALEDAAMYHDCRAVILSGETQPDETPLQGSVRRIQSDWHVEQANAIRALTENTDD